MGFVSASYLSPDFAAILVLYLVCSICIIVALFLLTLKGASFLESALYFGPVK